ncbi:hypothetical protein CQP30_12590 [Yersinia pestis]|nr:hypothetical protein EGX74_19270 [Yersinia pestis]EIR85762.1 hypothetical protein YPPY36_3549 [Yersinia pestis PY-36]EIR88243.1 hypothetical protein YPPY42_3445 [Yersinia pestis PY-42]EIS27656.1 hypothetical protein YPPY55_3384 [Yersinia pestis PY-55]EIS88694.1 hypothetical protein YPPY88_3455 [Yersinia pestis PY-88]EIS92978.1 hypothetical protein YPPY89_3644 [Yersinia pestis PY-89]EIT27473.1 hypothetical protein YPPY96_3334 [Yersinia pestis PY-96]OVY85004.1 hypothetical protein BFI52_106
MFCQNAALSPKCSSITKMQLYHQNATLSPKCNSIAIIANRSVRYYCHVLHVVFIDLRHID